MAAKDSTTPKKQRSVADPLDRSDQEEVYRLVRQALAVALYINESMSEDHASHACGAIVGSLHKIRCMMEGKTMTVSNVEVEHG